MTAGPCADPRSTAPRTALAAPAALLRRAMSRTRRWPGMLARLGRLALPARVRRGARAGVVALRDRVRPPTMDQRLARLERAAGGRLHVAATNLSDGRSVTFRAHGAAPLASTVKLALALRVLAQVDAGLLSLDAPVPVRGEHGLFGDGALDVLMRDAPASGVTRTVAELLRLSLVESDNTATDRLFDLAGGPAAVQQQVDRLGIRDLRVDRTIGQLLADRRRLRADAGGDRTAASREFLEDPRDTTTPAGMVQLLAAIQQGIALSGTSAAHLLSLMRACATSATRIRAGVPHGATVAHKTGTLQWDLTADVGLVTLPGGQSIALAIYLVGATASAAEQNAVVAGATAALMQATAS